jgi:glyoxylase-like metal-dependent hydrolase (beta-lactamase superfamily II)
MFVHSFFVKGLAHVSYIMGGKQQCAVIDPRRDVEEYIEAADAMGYTITHILETHLHADFISGHLELAKRTGAQIIAPRSAQCSFPHKAVGEGDEFELEHLMIRVIETPGHTPEHVCYLVTDRSRGSEPVGIFSGDTLFVGDVGRPDLFPGMADELAGKLFVSLGKLMELPDFVEVYPAHGAGSLCGKALSAKRSSTIGYERCYNPSLQTGTLEAFKHLLLAEMPAAPDHFKRCSATNGKGPELVESLPLPRALDPASFNEAIESGALVLDIRSAAAFGGQHVPGAMNIDITGNFPTFSGWVLPVERELLLVAEGDLHIERALVELRRVGLDRVKGWLEAGIHGWAMAGFPVASVKQVSVHTLKSTMEKGGGFTLLDVRAKQEYEQLHIDGALHMPVPDARERYKEIPPEPVVCICNSGHRSSLAASILLSRGLADVAQVPGGMMGWAAAGFSGECRLCQNVHGPKTGQKDFSRAK